MNDTQAVSWEFRKKRSMQWTKCHAANLLRITGFADIQGTEGLLAGRVVQELTGQAKSNRVGMVGSCQLLADCGMTDGRNIKRIYLESQ